MRNIVLDTNCLLMCLPKISPYRLIWDSFLEGQVMLCVSNEILEEYLEILSDKVSYAIAINIVSAIIASKHTRFITPYYKFRLIKSDEDDNKFVDCAIAANADYIVSEDAHFASLAKIPFPHVNVLRIKAFTELLAS